MSYLIDNCVLLRAFDRTSAHRSEILAALRKLTDSQATLVVAMQNMAEFWNVATRPLVNNGQGLSPVQAANRVQLIERFCQVLTENSRSYEVWKSLASKFDVVGVAVHDARLVATMLAHQVDHVITLNERDFRRYESEGIRVLNPQTVAASA